LEQFDSLISILKKEELGSGQGNRKNLDAALLLARLEKGVKYDVKNGVVTLKGDVSSENKRARAEKIASAVPNVQQVVNELEVIDQKATSTE